MTIVELMIVIAVAALIIALVLVAAPALQRNARNTQRRNDIGAIRSQLTTVISNNNNEAPDPTVFSTDVLGQIEQAIYKGNNVVANGIATGFCTGASLSGTVLSPQPTTQNGCTDTTLATIDTAGVWTAPGGIPNTSVGAGENIVYYIQLADATVLAAQVTGRSLPGPDELHIVVGAECGGDTLSDGNTNIGDGQPYATADLTYDSQKTVSFVYQLEGETKARWWISRIRQVSTDVRSFVGTREKEQNSIRNASGSMCLS